MCLGEWVAGWCDMWYVNACVCVCVCVCAYVCLCVLFSMSFRKKESSFYRLDLMLFLFKKKGINYFTT